jgi:hypothetical protein
MARRYLLIAVAFAGTVLAVAACGGSNGGVVPGPSTTPPFNHATPTPSPSPSPKHGADPAAAHKR